MEPHQPARRLFAYENPNSTLIWIIVDSLLAFIQILLMKYGLWMRRWSLTGDSNFLKRKAFALSSFLDRIFRKIKSYTISVSGMGLEMQSEYNAVVKDSDEMVTSTPTLPPPTIPYRQFRRRNENALGCNITPIRPC
uniref:Bestrophin homolog n=1 Tax=Rhabditophanes sp. KR3021 TaxID=114890 RepID=A0AC35TVS7_9BILA